ncbi:hypothetical protein [uncultured Draconibacterium sp.]|uniref:hypothetical protein n=1 Tax=uncultured Draconibacterium sp. TaxID=1573823 RepID=UPI0032164AAA
MPKFEIVKKNKIELLIYGLIGLVVIVLGLILWPETSSGQNFETWHLIILFVIVAILFAAFKIIPNIPIKKHIRQGYINFRSDRFIIENKQLPQKEISIKDVDNLSLKLVGFDGQHRFVNSREIKTTAYQPNSIPLNGLGNRLKFTFNRSEFEFEFYADSIDNYNNLKELVKGWFKINDKIKINILR